MSDYRIEPGSLSSGTCDCCGERSTSLTGFVYRDESERAVYYLRWTVGKPDDGAVLAIAIGAWTGDAPPSQRACVGLECQLVDGAPAFRVIDAVDTPWGDVAVLGKKLTRAQALASPLSKEAFAIVDRLVADEIRTEPWFRGAA
jgi:hypothetical protein